jgi:hypothetical protein
MLRRHREIRNGDGRGRIDTGDNYPERPRSSAVILVAIENCLFPAVGNTYTIPKLKDILARCQLQVPTGVRQLPIQAGFSRSLQSGVNPELEQKELNVFQKQIGYRVQVDANAFATPRTENRTIRSIHPPQKSSDPLLGSLPETLWEMTAVGGVLFIHPKTPKKLADTVVSECEHVLILHVPFAVDFGAICAVNFRPTTSRPILQNMKHPTGILDIVCVGC